MSKQVHIISKENPGMILTISFVLIAIINFLVFSLGNTFFPSSIVLGTFTISRLWAILLSGTALSVFTVLLMPFLTEWENNRGRVLSPMEMMAVYLVINVIGVWLITRKSEFFGLGVSSWLVVLILGIVLDFAQGMVMMQVEKMRKSSLGID